MRTIRERSELQKWPEPLPAARQVELAREMAHLRSRVRYLRLWKLAACRVQDLFALRRYDDLVRAAQRNYERVRNILWETNMSLVCWVAQRCGGRVLSLDELVEFGTLKLRDALDSYDPYHGAAISTYLTLVLQRECWRAIKKEQRRLARQRLVEDERDWEHLAGYYSDEEEDHWPVTREQVREGVGELDDREREILLARAGETRETLRSIGDRHGVSKERIRQVEREGLRNLARRLGSETVCCGMGRV